MKKRLIDADKLLDKLLYMGYLDEEKSEIETVVNGLIELEDVWITVSEKLPKDTKPVFVTWKNTDPKSYYQYDVGKHFIGIAYYKSGKWFWYTNDAEYLLANYCRCDGEEIDEAIEVVAWTPLPETYEAENEKGKE